jgi:hypothetical protein
VRRPWKTIVGFALLGLAIAAACYAYAAFYDYTKPMNGLNSAVATLSMILCPPQLLFTFCIDCEVIGWDGFILYSIIGALNAALYSVVGALVVSLRKTPSAPGIPPPIQ